MSSTTSDHTRRAANDFAAACSYLLVGLCTSVVAFVCWSVGTAVTVCLTPLLFGRQPLALSARALRGAANLDRQNARRTLGVPLHEDHRPATKGLRREGAAALHDPQVRRDFIWSVVHSIVGSTFGAAAVSAVISVVGMASLPLWYWAVPNLDFVGLWPSNTLPRALAVTALAVPAALITVWLVRTMAGVHARLAARWLTPAPPVGARAGAITGPAPTSC